MSGVKVILSLAFSKERVESMKVLMLNGSAKKEGNTYQSLLEVGKELERQGIEYEIFQIGSQPVRDCIGCGQCNENGCVFADDKVNEFVAKAKEADGFVFGTPVYYAHPSGRILSFLDRVFYSSGRAFAFKPAASVAVARRGGCSASFDVLNKYYGICQVQAVAEQNQKKALDLYYDLLALKEPPMRILFLLARQFNLLLQVKELQRLGCDQKTIASRTGLQSFVVRNYTGCTGRYTTAQLRQAVEDFTQTEEEVKTGRLSDVLSVELLIVKYARKNPA